MCSPWSLSSFSTLDSSQAWTPASDLQLPFRWLSVLQVCTFGKAPMSEDQALGAPILITFTNELIKLCPVLAKLRWRAVFSLSRRQSSYKCAVGRGLNEAAWLMPLISQTFMAYKTQFSAFSFFKADIILLGTLQICHSPGRFPSVEGEKWIRLQFYRDKIRNVPFSETLPQG